MSNPNHTIVAILAQTCQSTSRPLYTSLRVHAHMLSSPVQDVVNMMGKLDDHLTRQSQKGQDVTNTIHNYVRKFTTQICNLPIVDLDAALILSSKVSELSFLDVDQQHALLHAIDQRHDTAAKRSAIGRGQQSCESLEQFLLEGDWYTIERGSLDLAINAICRRASKLNMRCGNEKLKGRMASIVALFNMRNASPPRDHAQKPEGTAF